MITGLGERERVHVEEVVEVKKRRNPRCELKPRLFLEQLSLYSPCNTPERLYRDAVQNVDCSGGIGVAGGVRAGFWSCCRNLVGRLGAASPTLDLHLAPFGARDPKPLSPSFPIMNTLPTRFLEENSLVRRDQMGNDENEIEALPPRLKLLVQYLFSRDIRTHHGQSGNRMGNSGRIWCHEFSNGSRKWISLDPLCQETSSQRVQPCVTVLPSISGRGSSATPAPAFAPVESAVEPDLAGHDAKNV